MYRYALGMLFASACFDLHDLTPFPCATDNSCPSDFVCARGVGCVVKNSCDVSAQDCDGQKCTIVAEATADLLDSACVPDTGGVSLGGACARVDVGNDDCAAGTFCNSALTPDGSFVCRALCNDPADCTDRTQACVELVAETGHVAGFCAPTCRLGDGLCTGSRSCRNNTGIDDTTVTTCLPDGQVREWDRCTGGDCGHGLECRGYCFTSCGGSVGCGAGESCVAGAPGGNGACQCNFFGVACPSGASCRPLINSNQTAFGYCNINGTRHVNETCESDDDCAANLSCISFNSGASFTCRPLCDDTHACSTGMCLRFAGLANGGGVCR